MPDRLLRTRTRHRSVSLGNPTHGCRRTRPIYPHSRITHTGNVYPEDNRLVAPLDLTPQPVHRYLWTIRKQHRPFVSRPSGLIVPTS